MLTRTLLETKQDIPEFLQMYVPDGPEGENPKFETESDFDPNDIAARDGEAGGDAWGGGDAANASNAWGGGQSNGEDNGGGGGGWGAPAPEASAGTNGWGAPAPEPAGW